MMRFLLPLLAAPLFFAAGPAHAGSPLCARWSAPLESGSLDAAIVPESSGMALSRRFAGRLYHINDSGSGPEIHLSDLRGAGLRTVGIRGFDPVDTEDLATGPCGTGLSCVFVADIGDNKLKRDSVRVIVIEERESFPSAVEPLRSLELRYPDGAHNAEAFAVTPSGDFVIVTKELPARVYRLAGGAYSERASETLQAVGELAVDALYESPLGDIAHLVTGMALSPDGSRVLLLTYVRAIEAAVDLSRPFEPVSRWVEGEDYRLIRTATLPQQEAVTYLPGGADFLYSTERRKGFGAPKLISSRCLE